MSDYLTRADLQIAAEPGQPRTYLIADVAKMTHISERRILDHCRAGDLDHVKAGGVRVMTLKQIDAMLAFFSTGVTKPKPQPADPMERIRQASRTAADRKTPRRRAAA